MTKVKVWRTWQV